MLMDDFVGYMYCRMILRVHPVLLSCHVSNVCVPLKVFFFLTVWMDNMNLNHEFIVLIIMSLF